jgi:poly-gamma-glutamate synthesis protein (capsule biosynthesis protein)
MKVCRFLVEEGANAVICQHSHRAGCVESYRGGHIVYGQGNLVFDYPGQERGWYEGFLVALSISPDLKSEMNIIPYAQSDGRAGIRRMTDDEDREFRLGIEERSRAIASEEYVKQRWLEFCDERKHSYLSKALGLNRILGRLNRRGHVVKYLYDRRSLNVLRNTIRCEAHQDVLLTVLDRELRNGDQVTSDK